MLCVVLFPYHWKLDFVLYYALWCLIPIPLKVGLCFIICFVVSYSRTIESWTLFYNMLCVVLFPYHWKLVLVLYALCCLIPIPLKVGPSFIICFVLSYSHTIESWTLFYSMLCVVLFPDHWKLDLVLYYALCCLIPVPLKVGPCFIICFVLSYSQTIESWTLFYNMLCVVLFPYHWKLVLVLYALCCLIPIPLKVGPSFICFVLSYSHTIESWT